MDEIHSDHKITDHDSPVSIHSGQHVLTIGQISQISIRLAKIAEQLYQINKVDMESASNDKSIYAYLKSELKGYQERVASFVEISSVDPEWAIMVQTAVWSHEGRAASISSLCSASGAPTTTALRSVKKLVRAGLLEMEPDPSDRRRTLVRIHYEAVKRIEDQARLQLRRLLDRLRLCAC